MPSPNPESADEQEKPNNQASSQIDDRVDDDLESNESESKDSDADSALSNDADLEQFSDILNPAEDSSLNTLTIEGFEEKNQSGDATEGRGREFEEKPEFEKRQNELKGNIDSARGSIRNSLDFSEELGRKAAQVSRSESSQDRTLLEGEAGKLFETIESMEVPKKKFVDKLTGARIEKGLLLISSGDDRNIASGEMQLATLVRDNPSLPMDKEFRKNVKDAYANMARSRQNQSDLLVSQGKPPLPPWKSPLKATDIVTGSERVLKTNDPHERKENLIEALKSHKVDGFRTALPKMEAAVNDLELAHNQNLVKSVDFFLEGIRQNAEIAQAKGDNSAVGDDTGDKPSEDEELAIKRSMESKEILTPATLTVALAKVASGESSQFKPGKRKVLELFDKNPQLSLDKDIQDGWLSAVKEHHINKVGNGRGDRLQTDKPGASGSKHPSSLDELLSDKKGFEPEDFYTQLAVIAVIGSYLASEQGDNGDKGEPKGESKDLNQTGPEKETTKKEIDLSKGKEVTVEGERAAIAAITEDGKVVTRLLDRESGATAEQDSKIPEGFKKIDLGEGKLTAEPGVEYYMRPPQDKTSALSDGEHSFIKVTHAEDGTRIVQDATEEFAVVDKERIGPAFEELKAKHRETTLQELNLKKLEQVRLRGSWGTVAGITKDNKVIVEVAGSEDHGTGFSAPPEEKLLERGFEKIELDVTGERAKSSFYYRPADSLANVHSADELLAIESNFMNSPEGFIIADPSEIEPIREGKGISESKRSIAQIEIKDHSRRSNQPKKTIDATLRHYNDGVTIGVPINPGDARGENNPRDIRTFSIDGGKTNTILTRRGNWFHFEDGSYGEGNSKVHVNAINSADAAIVGKTLIPIIADALTENPQTAEGRKLKALNIVSAKILDPLNRDASYLDQTRDRELKYISKDEDTGKEKYKELHVGEKGQSSKNIVIYATDTESARKIARALDNILAEQSKTAPELILDAEHKTGLVSDGRRLTGSNRVSVSRDAWPGTEIAPSDYKEAKPLGIMSYEQVDSKSAEGENSIGALLETELGEKIRDRVANVYGNKGDLTQADLDRLSKEVGIRKGMLALDVNGKIAAHADMLDISRGDSAYVADGEKVPGDLTGRNALYSLYEFLHPVGEGRDPAYHQQELERQKTSSTDGVTDKSTGETRMDIIRKVNLRLAEMSQQDLSKLDAQKQVEFSHEFKRYLEGLELNASQELTEARIELDPQKSHSKATLLSLSLETSGDSVKAIEKQLRTLVNQSADPMVVELVNENLKDSSDSIDNVTRRLLTKSYLAINAAEAKSRNVAFTAANVSPSSNIDAFISLANKQHLVDRIVGAKNSNEAGQIAERMIHKYSEVINSESVMQARTSVEFTDSVNKPTLTFTRDGKEVDIIAFTGGEAVDTEGTRHPFNSLQAKINIPDSYRTHSGKHSEIQRAIFNQLTALNVKENGSHIDLRTSIQNLVVDPEQLREARSREGKIVKLAAERFDTKVVVNEQHLKELASLKEVAAGEFKRQGLPEFYASDNLVSLNEFSSSLESTGRSGEFSSSEYKIRVQTDAVEKESITVHEAEHLARAQRLAKLQLAFGSEFNEITMDASLANVGKGGLIRTASDVTSRKDNMSQRSADEMRTLVREFVESSEMPAELLRGIKTSDVEKFINQRTDKLGRIRGASSLQFETGAMTVPDIVETLKSEVVNYACTNYEAGLNIEPTQLEKVNAVTLHETLKKVGTGGVRLTSHGGTARVSRYRDPAKTDVMKSLIRDYVKDSNQRGGDLDKANISDAKEWLESRFDRVELGRIVEKFGDINNVANDLYAETSSFARTRSVKQGNNFAEQNRKFQRMVIETAMQNVGRGGPRFTRDGTESRPTYKNPASAMQMDVMVSQYLAGHKGSMFDLRNLTTEGVESWLNAREGNLPGTLAAEFGGDTKLLANEIRAELVHTGMNHYEQTIPHSKLPEKVYRHIMAEAGEMQDSVAAQIEQGKIESVRDLPDVKKLTGNLARDSVGRVSDKYYVQSRTEISARRVQLRDALRQEIWKSVENPRIRELIRSEGLKSDVVARASAELPANSPELRQLVREEGLKSPLVKQAIIEEGSKSNASKKLLMRIQLDVKREQLDKALVALDNAPNNREHQKQAEALASSIARDLVNDIGLSSHGKESLEFLVDMKLLSPHDPVLKGFSIGKPQNVITGTAGYDNLNPIDFDKFKEASKSIKSDLLFITSSGNRTLDTTKVKETLERASLTAVKLITDSDMKIAERLGLPVEFIDSNNLDVRHLDNIQGKYDINKGESTIGVNSDNPIVTATHELGHKARWLELQALAEMDPSGVRLAIMDNVLKEIGKPGSTVSDKTVSERQKLVAPEAIESYKNLVNHRLLSVLKDRGYDVEAEIAKLPPLKEGYDPVLLKEFGGSQKAIEESLAREAASFSESIDLLDTSKLNPSSRKIVDHIKNGRAGEVVRLAMHNLVESTGKPIDPANDIEAIQEEVARLTARDGDTKESGMQISREFVTKILADHPIDMKGRDLRIAIQNVADRSSRELVQHTINAASESFGGEKPTFDSVKSLLSKSGIEISDNIIKDVLANPVEVGTIDNLERRRLIEESKGEIQPREIARQIRVNSRALGVEASEYSDIELKQGLIEFQNKVHERMLERMSNTASDFVNRAEGNNQLEPAKIDGRTSPLVQKHIRSFTLDAVAREKSGTSTLPYAISSDEIAARKPEIALRAQEVNRKLRSLPAGADSIGRLQREHRQYTDYLKYTSRQQLIHKAILENDTKTASRMARDLVKVLATNVEQNKPIVEWLMSNSLLERGDIKDTALEGFFTPEGRARAVTLERMHGSGINSQVSRVSVDGNENRNYMLSEPKAVRDLKQRPVEVSGVSVSKQGKISFIEASTGRPIPVERLWNGNFEADFEQKFGKVRDERSDTKVRVLMDYVELLGSEHEKGTVYDSTTEARLRVKNAINENFKIHVGDEAKAIIDGVHSEQTEAKGETWKAGRAKAEASLLKPAQDAAVKLGLPAEAIAAHNILVTRIEDAAGQYGDGMVKINPTASDPLNVLEHEVKHLQESFDRTALKLAAPELFDKLVLEDCLSHIGQGGKRRKFQQVNVRPKFENEKAVEAMRNLVRDAINDGNLTGETGEIEKWLQSKDIAPELIKELQSERNVAREIGLEMRHYQVTKSSAAISEIHLKSTGNGVLTEAAKKYIATKQAKFETLAKSEGAYRSNPEVQKLMTGISNDAVGRVDKSFYRFSIEEIRARRFEHTRKLSRLVDRGVTREELQREFPESKHIFNDIKLGNHQERILLDLQRIEQTGDSEGEILDSAKKNAREVLKLLPKSYESSNDAVKFMFERGLVTESEVRDAGYGSVVGSVKFQENVVRPERDAHDKYMEAHFEAFLETQEKILKGNIPEPGKLNEGKSIEGGGREFTLKRPIKVNWGPLDTVHIESIIEKDGRQSVKLKFRDGKSFSYPLGETNALYTKFGYALKSAQGQELTGQQKMDLLVEHWESLERLGGFSPGDTNVKRQSATLSKRPSVKTDRDTKFIELAESLKGLEPDSPRRQATEKLMVNILNGEMEANARRLNLVVRNEKGEIVEHLIPKIELVRGKDTPSTFGPDNRLEVNLNEKSPMAILWHESTHLKEMVDLTALRKAHPEEFDKAIQKQVFGEIEYGNKRLDLGENGDVDVAKRTEFSGNKELKSKLAGLLLNYYGENPGDAMPSSKQLTEWLGGKDIKAFEAAGFGAPELARVMSKEILNYHFVRDSFGFAEDKLDPKSAEYDSTLAKVIENRAKTITLAELIKSTDGIPENARGLYDGGKVEYLLTSPGEASARVKELTRELSYLKDQANGSNSAEIKAQMKAKMSRFESSNSGRALTKELAKYRRLESGEAKDAAWQRAQGHARDLTKMLEAGADPKLTWNAVNDFLESGLIEKEFVDTLPKVKEIMSRPEPVAREFSPTAEPLGEMPFIPGLTDDILEPERRMMRTATDASTNQVDVQRSMSERAAQEIPKAVKVLREFGGKMQIGETKSAQLVELMDTIIELEKDSWTKVELEKFQALRRAYAAGEEQAVKTVHELIKGEASEAVSKKPTRVEAERSAPDTVLTPSETLVESNPGTLNDTQRKVLDSVRKAVLSEAGQLEIEKLNRRAFEGLMESVIPKLPSEEQRSELRKVLQETRGNREFRRSVQNMLAGVSNAPNASEANTLKPADLRAELASLGVADAADLESIPESSHKAALEQLRGKRSFLLSVLKESKMKNPEKVMDELLSENEADRKRASETIDKHFETLVAKETRRAEVGGRSETAEGRRGRKGAGSMEFARRAKGAAGPLCIVLGFGLGYVFHRSYEQEQSQGQVWFGK